MKLNAFFLFTVFAIASCELVVDVDTPDFESSIVLNATLQPDSTILVGLSSDKYVLDDAPFRGLRGAQVTLFENGQEVGRLTELALDGGPEGFYRSDFMPTPGQEYRMEVVADGYTSVTALETIPQGVPEFNVEVVSFVEHEYAAAILNLQLELDDEPGNDYYQIAARVEYLQKNPIYAPGTGEYLRDTIFLVNQAFSLDSEDLVFEEHTANLLLFDDKLFDGRSYTLDLEGYSYFLDIQSEEFDQEAKLTIEVRKVSEAYYQYVNTSSLQNWISGDLVSEPVQIFTNVENGRGVLGSFISDAVEFELGQ